MAKKFLYAIAVIIVLIFGAGLVYQLYGDDLVKMAMVPSEPFVEQKPLAATIYDDPKMWLAGPDGAPTDLVSWKPEGQDGAESYAGTAAIFFVHPTSYLEKAHWNAPLDDKAANDRARLFVRSMATPFALSGRIWAPRYRQAAFGAFLTEQPEGAKAIDAAYRDVAQAFDHFLAKIKPDQPIILAGHSQGSLHLTRLIKDKVAGTPLAKRIVAAYIIGWPVSIAADLPALGMQGCSAPDQGGCVISYQSFGQPADYSAIVAAYDATPSLTGQARKGTPMLCTNPLTGGAAPSAEAKANQGTVKPNADMTSGALVKGAVGAACDAQGFLLLSDNIDLGSYVLPGNNYHVYDIPLFWENLRVDAARRLARFR